MSAAVVVIPYPASLAPELFLTTRVRVDPIQQSDDGAVSKVGEDHGDGCAAPVIQGKEARRLQLPCGSWALLLTGHARVQRRQRRHDCQQDKERVDESNASAEPPGRSLEPLERCCIDAGKQPTVQHVRAE